jgi:chromo domain-containing protein 1
MGPDASSLQSHGYSLLRPGARPHPLERVSSHQFNSGNADDFDLDDADALAPKQSIVFLPPRGDGKTMGRARNDLFDATIRAQGGNSLSEGLVFTYRPTLSWYSEQLAQGRGYEHIKVDSWDNLLEKIMAVKAPDQKAGPAQPQRRG